MPQQINLFPLLPKPDKYHLTPLTGLRLLAGFAALLLVIYLFNLVIYFWQQQKLTNLQQTQQSTQQQLTQLNEKHNKHQPLSWQNQQLAVELRDKLNKLAKLKQTKLTTEQGYADYLLSFAANITPGVWLTQIHIANVDQSMDLNGSATSSSAVMQFIQNLRKTPLFSNKIFNVLRLENSTESSASINFTLNTNNREQNASTNGKAA